MTAAELATAAQQFGQEDDITVLTTESFVPDKRVVICNETELNFESADSAT